MLELKLFGWSRKVKYRGHHVKALPLRKNKRFIDRWWIPEYDNYKEIDERSPLNWESNLNVKPHKIGMRAHALLRGISLNGDFRLQVDMNKQEIRTLLKNYIKEQPLEALTLISELQNQAVKSIIKSAED